MKHSKKSVHLHKLTRTRHDLSKILYLAEHEEGRLCLVDFIQRNEEYYLDLDIYIYIYIMLENHQWEFWFRVFFEDFQQYGAYDSYPKCVSCLKIGKILVYSHTAKKWYLYDIKSKALEFVDLKSSSLDIIDVSLLRKSSPLYVGAKHVNILSSPQNQTILSFNIYT